MKKDVTTFHIVKYSILGLFAAGALTIGLTLAVALSSVSVLRWFFSYIPVIVALIIIFLYWVTDERPDFWFYIGAFIGPFLAYFVFIYLLYVGWAL